MMLVADWLRPVTAAFDRVYTTDVTVWYLARSTPPEPLGSLPFDYRCETHPRAAHYRTYYDAVGGPWLWWMRRALTAAQLENEFVKDDRLFISADLLGQPLGMVEIEWTGPLVAEIRNFGLVPQAVGRGFGKPLMRLALNQAWRAGLREVQLNTCSLDHAHALAFYKATGFRQINLQRGRVQIPHRLIDRDLLQRIKSTGTHRP